METKEATSEKTDRPERRFHHKSKKTNRLGEDIYWECSVCTYQNGKEAFKCAICDVRKGTSTRKPRLNSQLMAQQVAQQFTPIQNKKTSPKKMLKKLRPRLKNVDRDSAQQMAVTVGNVTVIITDFKLLTPDRSPCNSPERNSPTSTTDDIFTEPGPSCSLSYNILPPSPEMTPEST